MAPPFEVHMDVARRRNTIVVRGLWDLATMAAFERENAASFVRYRASGGGLGSLLTLIDLREAALLPQDVATAVAQNTGRYAPYARRIATVVSGSVLQLIQNRRILSATDVTRTFTDHGEALAWLDEALNPAKAPSADRPDPARREG